jgi:hypothetical protein
MTSLGSALDSFVAFFCGVVSVTVWVFLLLLVLGMSFTTISGADFFSSSFCGCFFCTEASSLDLRVAPLVVGVFVAIALLVAFVGVTGGGFTEIVAPGVRSMDCFTFLAFEEVSARIGVTGITGTAGVIVDDAVRDMGREPGRDLDSSITARGIAGAEKPGGIVGVARRGCTKKWPLIGVLGTLRVGSCSGSVSLTSASTLNDACSSAIKDASSVHTVSLSLCCAVCDNDECAIPYSQQLRRWKITADPEVACQTIKYIKVQGLCSHHLRHLGEQNDFQEAISLLESKHADLTRQEGVITYMRWP